MKRALEGVGFKVEDIYMTRKEVERLIVESRRKAEEEALDDKRVAAVEKIIGDAVRQIVGMFQPAVQTWMEYSLKTRSGK